MADKQRISYPPLERLDPGIRAELDRCRREGTPGRKARRSGPMCLRASGPLPAPGMTFFAEGVCDHQIKELCRVYISRTVSCEYCGNQRSVQAAQQGFTEAKYDELLNFESSDRYDGREKAALAYAEAIAWHQPSDDALWDRLHQHFSEPELVELGCFIALTFGQQSWLQLLNIEHHQVLPGTSASLAPGFETAEAMTETRQSQDYWAKR